MLRVSRSFLAALAVLFTTHSQAAADFAECPQFFANKKPPIVAPRPMQRALCYDAFAILHSGESKTAVYVAQKLNRASVATLMKNAKTSSLPMHGCLQPNGQNWKTTKKVDGHAGT